MQVQGYGKSNSPKGAVGAPAVLIDHDLHIYALCEGVVRKGQTGANPSEVALAAIAKAVRLMVSKSHISLSSSEAGVRGALLAVRGALKHACTAVCRKALERSAPQHEIAITLVVILGSRAVVGYVGSSTLFLLREGRLKQLTRRASSTAKAPLAAHDPERYVEQEVDTFHFELLAGDRLVLCARSIQESVLASAAAVQVLSEPATLESATDRLLYLARSAGAPADTLAAVVLEIAAEKDRVEAEAQRREEVLLRIHSVRELSLFHDLTTDELLEMADRGILLIARPQETIFFEGQRGDAMYLIVEGRCALNQGNKVIAELGSGSHFGEMALLSDDPRSVTVVAAERTKLIRISRDDFQETLRLRPATGVKLLSALGKELSRRLAVANRQ